MIICRDCGHQNEEDDQFCGSCGSFLEFTGEKVVPTAPVTYEDADAEDSWKEKAKRALDVADENVAHHDSVTEKMGADDAALAAAVVAEEQAAKADEAERVRAEEAAKRLEESNAERARADERAKEAERELERLRERQAEEAEKARQLAEEKEREAERSLAAKLAAAEEEAQGKAQREREALEQRLAEQQRAADKAKRAAAEEAERARLAEEHAEAQRKAVEQKLEEAAAAAAAATLRASQERDAVAAAEAARLASEAEAQRSRIAAEAAAAQAAEEVARIRAEAEAAKAEAAELRAQASAEASRTELEREQLRAEREAAEQSAAARRRVEEQEAADRQRRDAEAHAALVKAQAEQEAAQRKAEAELEAKKAEAEAAKARAEEERARLAAEAEAAKRDREEALRKAAALVAPKSAPASSAVGLSGSGAGANVGVAKPSKSAAKEKDAGKGSKAAAKAIEGGTTPGARLPGSAAPKMAPKKVRDAELNPGDLVCGQCGTGNLPARKFCRRCGTSLVEAKKAKLGLFARLRSWKRRRKQRLAGDRKGMKGAAVGARSKGRKAWYGVARLLSRISAVVAVFALLGFGVEPIRQKLRLPNVRQKAFDVVRKNAKPIYDPIRPNAATASSTGGGTSPAALIDLGSNTSWMAKASPSGGVGSRVIVTFEKPVDIARVLLTPGLAESTERGKGFVSQPRPSELRVTFNDDLAEPQVVKIADDAKPQVLNLQHKETRKVTFEISQVYPAVGGKGKSVALTEIEFFERRKIGDDFEKLPKPQFTSVNRKNLVALGDEDLASSWVTAKTDDGVGQGFSVVFSTPTDLNRIRIAPGNAEANFQSTPRPREVQLAFTCEGRCPATKQITFKDKPGFKNIGIDATGVTRIEVVIRTVYGTGDGAAFAEIEFLRKRPPAN